MDKSQFESNFCFASHRHLKSETYRTLVQILSHCYGHSRISAPQEPISGMRERGELVSSSTAMPDNSQVQGNANVDDSVVSIGLSGGFADTQMAMDEIEHVLEIDDNENLSKLEDLMVCDTSEGTCTGFKDTDFNLHRMLMDELENIVNGDDEFFQGNRMNSSPTLMEKDQSKLVALTDERESHIDVQQIVTVDGSKTRPRVDEEQCASKFSKPYDSTEDNDEDHRVAKPVDEIAERSFSLRNNEMDVQHEKCWKETEVEKSVHSNGIMACHGFLAEHLEIEEGEISGEYEVDDMSFAYDLVSEEKKTDDKQVSEDSFDKRKFPCSKELGVNKKFPESTPFRTIVVDQASKGSGMDLKETAITETRWKSGKVSHGHINSIDASWKSSEASFKNAAASGQTSVESATEKQGIASSEKLDTGVTHKKKRSVPSKEKKAKKKLKERKKRAEKNRELGVKRLKLRPVVQPKTVTFCRHYLSGRCHEGDKCKFSHNTVPLTKSMPCCHFARESCLKGNDCPFDHQLSKYPCNNFVTKGVCSRGVRCKFSHEMPPKEAVPSASGVSRPELEPLSSSYMSNSQKQPHTDRISHQKFDASFNFQKVLPFKNTSQTGATPVMKSPAVPPKGISCLFFGNSSVLEANTPKQGSSSSKSNHSGKVRDQNELTASDLVHNRSVTSSRTPPAVPSKCVNFLSIGNAPSENSSGKKLASLLQNRENGVKSSLLANLSAHKLASSPPDGENSAKIREHKNDSVLSSIQKPDEMLKITQPTVTPQGINFVTSETNESVRNNQVSLFSSSGNGIHRSHQESGCSSDKQQASSRIPLRPPVSPLVPAQSSNNLAYGLYKSSPNSAQKAIMSTLQFAARIESEMKMKINKSAVSNDKQARIF